MRHALILALLLLLAAAPARAEDKKAPPPKPTAAAVAQGFFEKNKQTTLASLDRRIAELQAKKTCIEAATTPAALLTCAQTVRGK